MSAICSSRATLRPQYLLERLHVALRRIGLDRATRRHSCRSSSDHLAKVALGLIFGLLGSSVIAFLQKVRLEDRALAGGMLLAISCGSLAGLYSGIFVSEYQLLTPKAHRSWDSLGVNTESNRDSHKPYVRGLDQTAVAALIDGFADHHYTRDEVIQQITEMSRESALRQSR
jgi:hypothetical protein